MISVNDRCKVYHVENESMIFQHRTHNTTSPIRLNGVPQIKKICKGIKEGDIVKLVANDKTQLYILRNSSTTDKSTEDSTLIPIRKSKPLHEAGLTSPVPFPPRYWSECDDLRHDKRILGNIKSYSDEILDEIVIIEDELVTTLFCKFTCNYEIYALLYIFRGESRYDTLQMQINLETYVTRNNDQVYWYADESDLTEEVVKYLNENNISIDRTLVIYD